MQNQMKDRIINYCEQMRSIDAAHSTAMSQFNPNHGVKEKALENYQDLRNQADKGILNVVNYINGLEHSDSRKELAQVKMLVDSIGGSNMLSERLSGMNLDAEMGSLKFEREGAKQRFTQQLDSSATRSM